MQTGKLIIVDGIAGSGKTVLIDSLLKRLRDFGIPAVSFLGSGQGEFSSDIRQTFMRSNAEEFIANETASEKLANQITRVDLMIANIWNSMMANVIPALNNGDVVIMDRSIYSTIAHQGESDGIIEYISRNWELRHNFTSNAFFEADYTIHMAVSPQVSIDRFKLRALQNPEDAVTRKVDNIGNKELSRKVGYCERYEQAFRIYPGSAHIRLDMDNFSTVDYSGIETMLKELSAWHASVTKCVMHIGV